MAARVASLGLDDAAATLLEHVIKQTQAEGHRFDSPETLVAAVAEKAGAHDILILGSQVENPVQLAQRIRSTDAQIVLVFVAAGAAFQALRSAVLVSPFLGKAARCVDLANTDRAQEDLRLLMVQVETQRRGRAMASFARRSLGALGDSGQAAGAGRLADRLLGAAPIGIALTRADGSVVAWSAFAASMTGRTERDVLGKKLAEALNVVAPTQLEAVLAMSRKPREQELLLAVKDKDGRTRTYELGSSEIALEGDEPGQLVLFSDATTRIHAQNMLERTLRTLEKNVADRTAALQETNHRLAKEVEARRQSQVELQQSNRELETFAYVASHDLQEPLRTVASFVQLLEKRHREDLDEESRRYIQFAVSGVHRMQSLISDLLEYSRVDRAGHEPTAVDTQAIWEAALESQSQALAETKAKVTGTGLPVVRGDRSQVRSLVENLLSNAIKFRGSKPPKVELRANREGKMWRFRMIDHGLGIDPKFQDKAFQMFQRLKTDAKIPGTGIGLAICRRIVERHGGTIASEPTPGGGATLIFTLPADEAAAPSGDAQEFISQPG